jgi:hypothetical protein
MRSSGMLELHMDVAATGMDGIVVTGLGVYMGVASWEGHARALGADDVSIARAKRALTHPGDRRRGT